MARLFHSLVVCGAGLTLLQCGGRYAGSGGGSEPDEGEGASSQGGATSHGGASHSGTGSGGKLTLGGSSTAGTNAFGGSATGGGGPIPTAGTTSTDPGFAKPPGPTAQWVCDATGFYCSSGVVDLTDLACKADPSRPQVASDCAGNLVFACALGLYEGRGVPFNCECVPPAADGASCVCPELDGGCQARLQPPGMCSPFASECGCTITCILK